MQMPLLDCVIGGAFQKMHAVASLDVRRAARTVYLGSCVNERTRDYAQYMHGIA